MWHTVKTLKITVCVRAGVQSNQSDKTVREVQRKQRRPLKIKVTDA